MIVRPGGGKRPATATPRIEAGRSAGAAPPGSATRRIAMLIYPGICLLDASGPLDAFEMANCVAEDAGAAVRPYRLLTVAATMDPVPTSAGFSVNPTHDFDDVDLPVDTVLVSGGEGRRAAARDERLTAFLVRASRGARRVGSICTGAFPLAAAGLLDGRQATTHWSFAAELQRSHPGLAVDADRIFTRDGKVYTSAGILAGVDLALALIEEDLGAAVALQVARGLVVPFRRAGGQAQFSTQLRAQFTDSPVLRRVQDWAVAHPETDLAVGALAARAGMSSRNFARNFKRATGSSPAEFVMRVRLERARALLESTPLPLKTIATRCGLGSADAMRRTFVERLGVSPTDYRQRFSREAAPPVWKPPPGTPRAGTEARDFARGQSVGGGNVS